MLRLTSKCPMAREKGIYLIFRPNIHVAQRRVAISALLAVLWSILLWYCSLWILSPLNWFESWNEVFPNSRLFDGYNTSMFYYFLPPLAGAFFAHIFLSLKDNVKESKCGNFRTLLQRVGRKTFVGPFGIVLNVGETFWAIFIGFTTLWIIIQYDIRFFDFVDADYVKATASRIKLSQTESQAKFQMFSINLGWAALITLVWSLFFVSRDSVLLRVAGIPFESAVKYHRWMSHSMLTLSLLHSIAYCIYWLDRNIFWEEVVKYQKDQVNHVAGKTAMIIGIIIWITSIGPIRRRFFELFYYTHHIMYFAFIFFVVMHLGDWSMVYLIPPLLFYGLDRVIRMYQSMNLVQVKALTVLSDKSVSIDIPISEDFKYKAMDVIFVNVPSVSYLQWHPFSISSSPLDNKDRLTIVVKPTGHWTNKLHAVATSSKTPLVIKIDGPYGHPQEHFYNYDSLILVAGGIGITPLLSLLKEILHRAANSDRVPSYVHLVWATKSAASKKLLDDVQAVGTLAESAVRVKIDIHLTEEKSVADVESHEPFLEDERVVWNSDRPMQPRAGSGSELLSLLMLVVYCSLVFTVFSVLARIFLKHDEHHERKIKMIDRGIMYYFVYLIVAFFGGSLAVFSWRTLKSLAIEGKHEPLKLSTTEFTSVNYSIDYHIGRPIFSEIFEMQKNSQFKEVGVIASGPVKMVKSVALACKQLTPTLSLGKKTILNFHDISFTL